MQAVLQFEAQADNPDLRLNIKLDGLILEHNLDVCQCKIIEIAVDDDQKGDHLLEIEMTGKTWNHTTIDPEGKITSDALIYLRDFRMDDIPIDQLVWENARYHHDHNGTGATQDHDFFGSMGCNGTVRLAFHTPVYLWLLENM